MFLDRDIFKSVVEHTPLVAIDLIIENDNGEILLGERLNRPAKFFWFVPGGRIYKNESLDDAFKRISKAELGVSFTRSEAKLIDIYEHFYPDSIFGEDADSPSTHYVVIAYHLHLHIEADLFLPNVQHSSFCWFSIASVLQDNSVHDNSKIYAKKLLNSI